MAYIFSRYTHCVIKTNTEYQVIQFSTVSVDTLFGYYLHFAFQE
ncbi:hypothetical protein [Candidatus Syntrophosphaera thermopropionivorans]|nr:hypothetical protein [Candidatus Syntrophosphaera thermopropionivorans]